MEQSDDRFGISNIIFSHLKKNNEPCQYSTFNQILYIFLISFGTETVMNMFKSLPRACKQLQVGCIRIRIEYVAVLFESKVFDT